MKVNTPGPVLYMVLFYLASYQNLPVSSSLVTVLYLGTHQR
jgi:NADH:ubiquinone oxidoreductase subunit H